MMRKWSMIVLSVCLTGSSALASNDWQDAVGNWMQADVWELAHCLDPYDPGDANGDRNGDGYTNIEEYINWIPLREPMPTRADLNCDNRVDLYDFSEFAEHYYSSSGNTLYDERYDLNNNNVISMDDLLHIAQDWLWFRQGELSQ